MNPLEMTGLGCRREHDVQQAASSGRWPAELEAHSAGCRTCADVRLIAETFAAGRPEASPARRTDPALLFARAREERRLKAEVQISLVTTLTQLLLLVGVLGLAIYFVPLPSLSSLTWPSFARWPSMSLPALTESWPWTYGAAAFVMASIFALVHWTSQDA